MTYKDTHVDLEYVTLNMLLVAKISVDTAEHEPWKDPEKLTIQSLPLVISVRKTWSSSSGDAKQPA